MLCSWISEANGEFVAAIFGERKTFAKGSPEKVQLIAGAFEISLHVPVTPGTRERTFVGKDVVQFPVHDEMYGIAAGVLRVGFDMDRPLCGIERDHFHRDNVR